MPVLRGVTMGNIGVIYRILRALDISMNYEEFDEGLLSAERLGISEPRRLYLLHMLLEAGLIEGIAIKIDCAGNFYISKGRPRLTLADAKTGAGQCGRHGMANASQWGKGIH